MHNISFSFSLWCWWNLHVEVGSCGLNISRVEQTLKPWELIKSVLILTLPLYTFLSLHFLSIPFYTHTSFLYFLILTLPLYTFLPSPSLDSCLFILPFPCSLPSYPPLPLLPIPSYPPLHFHPTFLSSSSLASYNLFLLLITLQTTFLISHLLLLLLPTFVFSSFFLSTFFILYFSCSLPSTPPIHFLPAFSVLLLAPYHPILPFPCSLDTEYPPPPWEKFINANMKAYTLVFDDLSS